MIKLLCDNPVRPVNPPSLSAFRFDSDCLGISLDLGSGWISDTCKAAQSYENSILRCFLGKHNSYVVFPMSHGMKCT